MRREPGIAAAATFACALAACGKAGAPVPPEPRGPLPPTQVHARQTGDTAVICFTVPQPRGAKPKQTVAVSEVLRVTYAPGLQVPRDPQAFRVRSQPIAAPQGEGLVPGRRICVLDSDLHSLEGGPAGWTLRYAVRLRDRAGRPSALIAAPDLVAVLPPDRPRGVRAEMTADGVVLRWEPPRQVSEPRYRIYRAEGDGPIPEEPLTESAVDRPEFLDDTASPGVAYRYQVRVEAVPGVPVRESAPSEEATVVATDRFPPASPTGLVAVQEGAAVRLFWNPNAERDLAGYRLERRGPDGDWAVIATAREPLHLDSAVVAGERWEYRVRAFDRADPPNESEPSQGVQVDVVEDPASGGGGGRP